MSGGRSAVVFWWQLWPPLDLHTSTVAACNPLARRGTTQYQDSFVTTELVA